MICALVLAAFIAYCDFNVAFMGAAVRLWDEATGQVAVTLRLWTAAERAKLP